MDQGQAADDFLKLNLAQAVFCIARQEKGTKIIQKQDIFIGSVKIFAVDMGIALLLK